MMMNKAILANTPTTTVFQRPEAGAFARHRKFLEDVIEPDSGLLEKLLESGALSWRQIADIKAKDTSYKRNSMLLDFMSENGKFDCLVNALTDVKQRHIVNYLIADGEYMSEFGGCWPLMDEELSTLQVNYGRLVEILDPCGLVVALFSADVITSRQKEFVCCRQSRSDQNEALLEIIRRRSLADYRKTIDCLHASNQSHVAQILADGGVIVRVDADLAVISSVVVVDEAEDEISSAMASMVSGRSIDEVNRILHLTQVKCIAAQRGDSVLLYVYCATMRDLQDLHEMLIDGRLRFTVQRLFNRLLQLMRSQTTIAVTTVKADVSTDDFEKAEKYFRDVSERRLLRAASRTEEKDSEEEDSEEEEEEPVFCSRISSQTTVSDLPLELMDVILQKSYLHFVLSGKQLIDRGRDESIISRLTSVDNCWFQRFRRRRFKKTTWNHLAEFYKTLDVVAGIVRNNQRHLVEHINASKEFVGQLRATDCLSDLHVRLITRKQLQTSCEKTTKWVERGRRRNNNSDVLHLMMTRRRRRLRSSSSSSSTSSAAGDDDGRRRSAFVRCLNRTSDQRLIAEVIENGGVVVRATIRTEDAIVSSSIRKRRSLEEELVRRMDGLRADGWEVMRGDVDGGSAVASIWCRSQLQLSELRKMKENRRILSQSLSSAITKRPSTAIPQTIQLRIINIDEDQFRKITVERSVQVRFVARLSVGKSELEVKGVTKLRNEIYALCRSISVSSPNVIRVFEDRNPFRLQKEVDIKDITDPEDIGSSERDNLLYVTDLGRKCVWKVTREADDYPVIVKWSSSDLRWPYTLSVTSDGQLLMLSAGDPISCLEIFGSDAERCLCIQLPREIQKPLHAVQTSTKSFVITHKRTEAKQRKKEEEEKEEAEDEEEEAEEEAEEETAGGRDRETWSVSELTGDGQTVIRRFVGRDATQQLNSPLYLSLDSMDRVFVADTVNSRVVLLDSDLRWNRVLCPTKDEAKAIFRSWRLSFDSQQNQLIVGGLNRAVNVYALCRK